MAKANNPTTPEQAGKQAAEETLEREVLEGSTVEEAEEAAEQAAATAAKEVDAKLSDEDVERIARRSAELASEMVSEQTIEKLAQRGAFRRREEEQERPAQVEVDAAIVKATEEKQLDAAPPRKWSWAARFQGKDKMSGA